MLAGEPPFSGRTAQAVIAHHMMSTPPSLKLLRPTVPTHTAKIVEKGLAKAPADRFASASELLAALDTPIEGIAHSGAEPGAMAGVEVGQAGLSVTEWIGKRWAWLRERHFLELLLAWAVITWLAILFIMSLVKYLTR
jgi:serine/threonine-protein kinase